MMPVLMLFLCLVFYWFGVAVGVEHGKKEEAAKAAIGFQAEVNSLAGLYEGAVSQLQDCRRGR